MAHICGSPAPVAMVPHNGSRFNASATPTEATKALSQKQAAFAVKSWWPRLTASNRLRVRVTRTGSASMEGTVAAGGERLRVIRR